MTMGWIHKKRYRNRLSLEERTLIRRLTKAAIAERAPRFEPPPEPVKVEPKVIKRIVMSRDKAGNLTADVIENPPAVAVVAKKIGPTICLLK